MGDGKTFPYRDAPGTGGDRALPPLLFKDVNLAFLPLRADILALRRFCDDYLNVVPPEVAQFQPSGPLVLLGIINYGSMSSEVLNTGWVAQNEVVFSIPVDWYHEKGGRLTFHDRATTSPFIFVDSASSQVTGRETFGWPKEHVWLSREESSTRWGSDELERLVTLRARPVEGGSRRWRREGRRFLEVARRPAPSLSAFPADPASPLNPWQIGARAVESSLRLAADGLAALLRLPGSGYPPPDPQAWMETAFGQLRQLATPDALLGSNVINFKQFPRAEHPQGWAPPNAAYQALVRSRMELAQFRRGGLLGESGVVLGDASGGLRVRLSRAVAGSILDTLGLEVLAEERWGDEDAAILAPVFPFWMDLDLRYARSETLCWRRPDWGRPDGRTPDLSWTDESGERPRQVAPKEHDSCLYNLSLRSPIEEITGRLSFPDTTLRVFPLFAPIRREAAEDAFCSGVLGDGHAYRRWGNFVYLIAESSEQVADRDTGQISRWAHRKLTFAVPVQRRRRGSTGRWRKGDIVEWGLVQPILFVDSDLEAIRCREVNGLPAARASLVSPPTVWMDQFQKEDARSSQLVLETELTSAVGPGRQVERHRLLEIYRGEQPRSGRPGMPFEQMEHEFDLLFKMLANPTMYFLTALFGDLGKELAGEPGRELQEVTARELRDLSEIGRAFVGDMEGEMRAATERLAERLLGSGLTLNHYSLKQFRDAEDSTRACYQSRVRQRVRLQPAAPSPAQGVPRLIEQFEERRDERRAGRQPLWLALHSYPVQAITRLLGLEPCWTDNSGDRIVDYFRPMQWSFWIKGTMDLEQADEGDHWEEQPASDPELATLLNAEHGIEDPLQIVKMLLDAQAPAGAGTRQKIRGRGSLESGRRDARELADMTLELRDSGRVRILLEDDSKPSFTGRWFRIFGVQALTLDRGPDGKRIHGFGVHVPGGATAVVGERLSLLFDPEREGPDADGASPAGGSRPSRRPARVTPIARVSKHVKIRQRAAGKSRLVGKLKPGQKLERLGSAGPWHEVRLTDGGRGFVPAAWTRVLED